MPRLVALSSSQTPSAEAMAEELYPDFFDQSLSPITNSSLGVPLEDLAISAQFETRTSIARTDQLSFIPQLNEAATGRFTSPKEQRKTEQLIPPTGTLNISATQSLVSALQATMKTNQAVRKPVVIPGQKRSKRAASSKTVPEQHMSPRLRMFIILAILLGILFISLLALSPLSAADSNVPLLKSLFGWTNVQQVGWSSFTAHILGNNQPPAVATTAQSANFPALPPIAVLSQSQYVAIAQQDAIAAGIPPTYFTRQIMLESDFNPNAVSPSGAVGIAQFLPSTAAGLGFNPYNPVAALKGAAGYMASLSNQYGGDYTKALAAYNAGSGTVNYAVQQGGANWMNFLPAETRAYIARIAGV